MDRGIAEISLVGDSAVFNIAAKPAKMSIPKDQRAYFEVTLTPKPETKTGNYPVNFRLVGGGKLFKTFSINAGGQATPPPVAPPPVAPPPVTRPVVEPTNQPPEVKPPKPAYILKVPTLTAAPAIDGVIKDSVWKTAAVLANFSSVAGGQAGYDTTGLLLHDARNLYLAFYCNDENIKALTEQDGIEIQFSLQENGRPAHSIFISPANKVALKILLADQQTAPWPASGISFVAGQEGRAWSLELAMPFSALLGVGAAVPARWYLRVIRTKASGNAETSFWAPAPSGYNSEKGFGTVDLLP
jgi:hypothetical protein